MARSLTIGRRASGAASQVVAWVADVVGGWRFPVLALSLIISLSVMMLGILMVPNAPTGFGAFAEDFKVWCFGYDPATGRLEWAYVATTITQPFILGAVILGVWWTPLRDGWRHARRRLYRWAAAPVVAVLIALVTFPLIGGSEARGELPFPAERLRTAHTPPSIELTNQEGDHVSLAALRGRVVMVTGVYATCGYTCPMIMGQARRVVEALPEELRRDLTVIAVTLDPERDDQRLLTLMAEGQGVSAPLFNLVTGDPAQVERTLDALQIARRRDPETGMIDHANLFILVDRGGRIAYRLTLGERQERWLGTALRLLLEERPK